MHYIECNLLYFLGLSGQSVAVNLCVNRYTTLSDEPASSGLSLQSSGCTML